MVTSPSDPRRELAADPDDPAAAARHRAALRRRDPEAHFAVIACVHGNLPALEAVFADIDRREIPRVVCLGDMIGYGPNPVECVDLVFERCVWTLMGHCDQTLFLEPDGFHYPQNLTESLLWSRSLLEPVSADGETKRETWQRLMELPEKLSEGGCDFVHGSPLDPVRDYLHPYDGFGKAGKIEDCFEMISRALFCAHSHMAFAFYRSATDEGPINTLVSEETTQHFGARSDTIRRIETFDKATLRLGEDTKSIINVGSVGQPRDRDARACYVEVCEDLVTWHRVEYDIEETIRRMAAIPEIHARLGQRLRVGRM